MSNINVLKAVDTNIMKIDNSPPRKRAKYASSTKKQMPESWSLTRKDLTLDEIYDSGFALLDSVGSFDGKVYEDGISDWSKELGMISLSPRKGEKEIIYDSPIKPASAKKQREVEVYLGNKQNLEVCPSKNYFDLMPDEVILQIFHWIPKRNLAEVALVSKRFYCLSQDESLWTRMDVSNRNLEPGALGRILSRQVIVLRLAQSEIADPPFLPGQKVCNEEFQSRLLYLDLSMAYISKEALVLLFSTCYRLKKVSLEHVPINDKVLAALSTNKDIEVLNLALVEGICLTGMEQLLNNCRKLRELNLAWTYMDAKLVSFICSNLPSSLDRLNCSGCRKQMSDANVLDIVNNCPNLRELDLSDCTNLTDSSIHYIRHLTELNFLALSRCYLVPYRAFWSLRDVYSLVYLDLHGGHIDTKEMETIKDKLGSRVQLNQFQFSSVARPTVGNKRSSIWGLRVRD